MLQRMYAPALPAMQSFISPLLWALGSNAYELIKTFAQRQHSLVRASSKKEQHISFDKVHPAGGLSKLGGESRIRQKIDRPPQPSDTPIVIPSLAGTTIP